MGADELDLRPGGQIEQQRRLLAIKLLRKRGGRFRVPRDAIRRAKDADVERFLLDDVGDGERKKKDPAGGVTHIERWAVAFDVTTVFSGTRKASSIMGRF